MTVVASCGHALRRDALFLGGDRRLGELEEVPGEEALEADPGAAEEPPAEEAAAEDAPAEEAPAS